MYIGVYIYIYIHMHIVYTYIVGFHPWKPRGIGLATSSRIPACD